MLRLAVIALALAATNAAAEAAPSPPKPIEELSPPPLPPEESSDPATPQSLPPEEEVSPEQVAGDAQPEPSQWLRVPRFALGVLGGTGAALVSAYTGGFLVAIPALAFCGGGGLGLACDTALAAGIGGVMMLGYSVGVWAIGKALKGDGSLGLTIVAGLGSLALWGAIYVATESHRRQDKGIGLATAPILFLSAPIAYELTSPVRRQGR